MSVISPSASLRLLARSALALALVLGSSGLAGCASVQDDVRRARRAYASAAYEDALIWLESVERDIPSADLGTRARWHYLRGMTAYRMGHRDDARHYLALAHVITGDRGIGLPPDWLRTLDATLAELRFEVPGETAGGEDAR